MSSSEPGGADPGRAGPPGTCELPAALAEIVHYVTEPGERDRLTRLFQASSRSIAALGELDLSAHEREEIGSADLSVWESLAPLIGATLSEVNVLLAAVRELVPEGAASHELDSDAAFDAFFDGAPAVPAAASDDEERKLEEAYGSVRAIAQSLEREVARFGEALRKPAVMADRWNLLDHLQAFRGRFRAAIGEMVFLCAGAFTSVQKELVVPFYREEIAGALVLRTAVTGLSFVVEARNEAARDAPPEEVRLHAEKILEGLEAFARSSGWTVFRAADKRAFLEAWQQLMQLLGQPDAPERRLIEALEGLDKFVQSLMGINHRETLMIHDRGAIARTTHLLGISERLARKDRVRSAEYLRKALRETRTLFGRDRDLDRWLRAHRALDPAAMDAGDVQRISVELRRHLESVRVL